MKSTTEHLPQPVLMRLGRWEPHGSAWIRMDPQLLHSGENPVFQVGNAGANARSRVS